MSAARRNGPPGGVVSEVGAIAVLTRQTVVAALTPPFSYGLACCPADGTDQSFTYSYSTGLPWRPLAGGATQPAILPGSRTGRMSDST